MVFKTVPANQPVRMQLWAWDSHTRTQQPILRKRDTRYSDLRQALWARFALYENRYAGEIHTLDGQLIQCLRAGRPGFLSVH